MRGGFRYRYKQILSVLLPALGLGMLALFFCWFFVARYGIFGSRVDWISQHSVIPDYFRQQFYETGELFPEFAANIGGGQNIYNFSYYGLFHPLILLSYLFPSIKMGDYLMAASFVSLAVSVILFYGWLLKRGFSGKISFMVSLMYLLSGPMIFHSYCQLMFVNYMPFLCMAFLGVDRYFERNGKLLYTAGVFLMIMSSFYFSIGGILALVVYGLYRYFECLAENNIACNVRNEKLSYEKNIACNTDYACSNDGINIACNLISEELQSGVGTVNNKHFKEKDSKINIAWNLISGFFQDGIRFLLPVMTAVLMSGILLLPTAAALSGRGGVREKKDLASLLLPNLQVDRLIYTPYGIGLTTLMITVLITGVTYKTVHERILSWGCTVILMVPAFAWLLNGGLYVREKALIPFLPLLCYIIACYIKKLEEKQITFAAGGVPFLITMGMLCAGWDSSEFSKYVVLFLLDAAVMAGCYLLFWWKKESLIIMVPAVVFLILFGGVFHEQANRIESREFYDEVTEPAIGEAVEKVLGEDTGFCRLEQVGNEEENAANLNRVWDMGQYISSIYSSTYNKEYQDFRKNVFGVEEPFRNDLMQSVSQNPVFLKMMGVRYLLSEQEVPGYETVSREGDIRICENSEAAPIAYVTDRLISEDAYDVLEFPYNQLAFACGAVRAEDGADRETDGESTIQAEESGTSGDKETEDTDAGSAETGNTGREDAEAGNVGAGSAKTDEIREQQILEEVLRTVEPTEIELPEKEGESLQIARTENGYRIRAEKREAVQIELPVLESVGDREEERIVFLRFRVENHRPGQDVAVWLEGIRNKLSARNHTYYNGNTVFSFSVVPEKGSSSVELALGKGDYELTDVECFSGGWGKQVNRERSKRLYQAVFQVDKEKTKGNVISGSVDVEKDGYFVTSIPYDTNFEILVDGKRAEYERVNKAFVGFEVCEGRHTVEIRYHAPGRKIGAWCSVIGVAMLLFMAFEDLRSRRRIGWRL